MMFRGWGTYLVARILLRLRGHGREPSEAEISDLCQPGKKAELSTLTEEDIIQAYTSGREVMSPSRCTLYCGIH